MRLTIRIGARLQQHVDDVDMPFGGGKHERRGLLDAFGGLDNDAARVAKQVGTDVDTELPPMMGAEDFSFMLNERPGAFIWVGNGESAGLHHPKYNFNDDVIPYGTSYWVKLVETALAG